ncbi:MAG: hypothetical protein WBG91_12605, partial [Syntrophobacteria bacterium]
MRMQNIISVSKGLAFVCFSVVTIASLMLFSTATADESEKLTIYVVNYPLQYFAERIAGEHARVV